MQESVRTSCLLTAIEICIPERSRGVQRAAIHYYQKTEVIMTKKLNPNKLLLSKWTATRPKNKEKHFIVTELIRDEDEQVTDIILEAVYTKNAYQLSWQTLFDDLWQQGWK